MKLTFQALGADQFFHMSCAVDIGFVVAVSRARKATDNFSIGGERVAKFRLIRKWLLEGS